MQVRPYDDQDGQKLWLSRSEQERLLEVYTDDYPRRRIALQLGLHGLRTDEIVDVEPQHFEEIPVETDATRYRLVVPDGKTGRRELPASGDLRQRVTFLKSASRSRQDEAVIDVSKRSIRDWIQEAREQLADETGDDRWLDLGMHDLRRTFATDSYYSLAFAGVPIAEQLVMSYGGWRQTQTGRETFRRDYLGPVPDHVTVQAMDELALP